MRWFPAVPVVFALACGTTRPERTSRPAPLPPPVRPADLLATAHLGRPQVTAEALSTALGTHLPVDLTLAVSLGVDFSVLGAADTTRPIDVVLTGTPGRPAMTVVLTPRSAAQARGALAGRYRFTYVPAIGGERLDPRAEQGASARGRLACALVPVEGAVTSRVVCGPDEALLARAGRWAAYESSAHASDVDDLHVTVDGESLRANVAPWLHAEVEDARASLAASAGAARREHARPPDFGDPEAVVALLGDLAGEVDAVARDAVRADATFTLAPEELSARVELALRADGASSVTHDALERVTLAAGHPLAALLPPDAFAAIASRGASAGRAATLRGVVDAALRVLGDRVSDPVAARADLGALVSGAGEEAALALARTPDGVETTLLLALADHGTSARAAIARMARAPWVRALRVGGAALSVGTAARGTLVLGVPPRAGETAPRALALSVRGDVLAVVLGPRATASLDAIAARAGGPLPAVIATGGPEGSVVGGIDLGALGARTGAPALPVRFAYVARREGGDVVVTARAVLPPRVLPVLRRLGDLAPRGSQ